MQPFSESDTGPAAKSARLALDALILKERLGTTDRESVEQIRENPYLPYFLGFDEYQDKAPFHPSVMTHFRKRWSRLLRVTQELYRQQLWMYQNRIHRIDDRLVSLYQPQVRPLVRGKAKDPVEFGAKISVSLVDGFSFVDNRSWDAFNASGDLVTQVEAYRRRFG